MSFEISTLQPYWTLKHVYYVTRSLKRGQIELGVHIADVSHFVRPGSLTDTEAKTRYI